MALGAAAAASAGEPGRAPELHCGIDTLGRFVVLESPTVPPGRVHVIPGGASIEFSSSWGGGDRVRARCPFEIESRLVAAEVLGAAGPRLLLRAAEHSTAEIVSGPPRVVLRWPAAPDDELTHPGDGTVPVPKRLFRRLQARHDREESWRRIRALERELADESRLRRRLERELAEIRPPGEAPSEAEPLAGSDEQDPTAGDGTASGS